MHIIKVIRLGECIGGETQPKTILKLVLGSNEDKKIILNKVYKTRSSNIRIRPDWSFEDQIKQENALTE